VASTAPDGRTLLLASTPAALELKSIARVASMPFVLIAESGLHSNLHDLIRFPGPRVLMGSAGERSVGHLAIERLRARHGSPVEAVAYNGGIAALNAVVAKQVSTALVPLPSVLPYLGGGRIRIWAVADSRRHAAIPHVPTTTEAGLADFEAVRWFEVLAPPATPRRIIQDLNALLANGPESKDARQLFTDLGLRLEHVPIGTPARTAAR
jgi:tripartite-type tricarboxylate transporter receptor subunit TctC